MVRRTLRKGERRRDAGSRRTVTVTHGVTAVRAQRSEDGDGSGDGLGAGLR